MWSWEINNSPVIRMQLAPGYTPSLYHPPDPPSGSPPELSPSETQSSLNFIPQLGNVQDIFDITGIYRLPFPFNGQAFNIISDLDVEEIPKYWDIRQKARPDQWCNIHGNTMPGARAVMPRYSEVWISPILAQQMDPELEAKVLFLLLVRMPSSVSSRDKGDHGTHMYMIFHYHSWSRAFHGLFKALSSKYEVVANWAEIDDESELKKHISGKTFTIKDRKVFVFVDLPLMLKHARKKNHSS
jgi:hypothetical protein